MNEILYGDKSYRFGSLVLGAGCGISAHNSVIAKNSPCVRIVSVDISCDSLAVAQK